MRGREKGERGPLWLRTLPPVSSLLIFWTARTCSCTGSPVCSHRDGHTLAHTVYRLRLFFMHTQISMLYHCGGHWHMQTRTHKPLYAPSFTVTHAGRTHRKGLEFCGSCFPLNSFEQAKADPISVSRPALERAGGCGPDTECHFNRAHGVCLCQCLLNFALINLIGFKAGVP